MTPPDRPHAAQASLEMTVALALSALLLLGSFKLCVWLNERLISRQQYYNATRHEAGQKRDKVWDDPTRGRARHQGEDGKLRAVGPLTIVE